MKLQVIRQASTDDGTPGKLTVLDTGWSCDTLELPWRDNKRGESCIIADTYACTVWHSPKLGHDVLRLEDKHGRQDCLVHNGNFAGDVAEHEVTQVHGCTEVGRGYGMLKKPHAAPEDEMQYGILRSVTTLAELIAEVGPGPHEIAYEWAEGCAPT